jgi:hypothetical protein
VRNARARLDLRGLPWVLLIAAAWVVGLQFHSLETGLLLLAPCLALAVALLLGRYPGERLLDKATGERSRAGGRRRSRTKPSWTEPVRRTSGGLLLGRSLAGRAPPLVALSQRAGYVGSNVTT